VSTLLKFGVNLHCNFVTLNKKRTKKKIYGNELFNSCRCNYAGKLGSKFKAENKFEHYSKMQLQNGMSGAEIAERCWLIMVFAT
jgi:hypothetical protein